MPDGLSLSSTDTIVGSPALNVLASLAVGGERHARLQEASSPPARPFGALPIALTTAVAQRRSTRRDSDQRRTRDATVRAFGKDQHSRAVAHKARW